MESSIVQPPSVQSEAEMRSHKGGVQARPRGRLGHFAQDSRAVFEAAAVFVGARVDERREELVYQVAVGGVDLDKSNPASRLRRAAGQRFATRAIPSA